MNSKWNSAPTPEEIRSFQISKEQSRIIRLVSTNPETTEILYPKIPDDTLIENGVRIGRYVEVLVGGITEIVKIIFPNYLDSTKGIPILDRQNRLIGYIPQDSPIIGNICSVRKMVYLQTGFNSNIGRGSWVRN